jgi:hypothetical protein
MRDFNQEHHLLMNNISLEDLRIIRDANYWRVVDGISDLIRKQDYTVSVINKFLEKKRYNK